MTCPRLTTYFTAARELVGEKFPELSGTRMRVGCGDIDKMRKRGSTRSYMHVNHYKDCICVHPDAERLPARNLWGLFLHEFGHLLAGNGEGEANMAILQAFGIRILYDEEMLQFVEGL